nr:thioredoxin family protein [uncultured Flavobacterium sp.]
MTFKEYQHYFETIINKPIEEQDAPFDNPDYMEYTKLNWSRMNRWLKTGKLTDDIKTVVRDIGSPQNWIIITEPWCGDAAHSVPFIEMIAGENPLISTSYSLRDSSPSLIDAYLTNGSKSIPKLVIRGENGKDIAIWGPRPENCQQFYQQLLDEKADIEKIKTDLQIWYNANKGQALQQELLALLQKKSN